MAQRSQSQHRQKKLDPRGRRIHPEIVYRDRLQMVPDIQDGSVGWPDCKLDKKSILPKPERKRSWPNQVHWRRRWRARPVQQRAPFFDQVIQWRRKRRDSLHWSQLQEERSKDTWKRKVKIWLINPQFLERIWPPKVGSSTILIKTKYF